ncbi:hypothetical protein FACS1894178_0970 [Bacteroidia bacterium]|nr:hypothetical protein FACS1894178_0970 [Bacteroidia bacterium]
MKPIQLITLCILHFAFCTSTVFAQKPVKIVIDNPLKKTIVDKVFVLPADKLPADFSVETYTVEVEKVLYPIEKSIDLQGNISYITIFDLHPKIKNINLVKGQASNVVKRTHAELSHKSGGHWARDPKTRHLEYRGGDWMDAKYLRVPDEHIDHSWYIRYEGPGWESDKVGYRSYLDWRNGYDIFGKTKPEICLPKVGLDGFDSYHEMQEWGMDCFKVGDALGVGSFAYWTGKNVIRIEYFDSLTCEIIADGNLRSQVRTDYFGWNYQAKENEAKINAVSLLSIDAGSRLTHQEVKLSKAIQHLCTGLIRDKKAEFFSKIDPNSTWSYIATFGDQSLNNDNLGIAVIVKTADIKEVTEDKLNHVVVFNSEGKDYLDYYFLGAWEQEPNGIKTREAFEKYLDEVVERLNN